jgi:hypothetical protein
VYLAASTAVQQGCYVVAIDGGSWQVEVVPLMLKAELHMYT